MTRVRFSHRATHDIAEIGAYIAKDNESISKDFISRIREKCRSFSATPLIGRKCEEFGAGVRVFPFGNYLIFYRLLKTEIVITRVIHGARNLLEALGQES